MLLAIDHGNYNIKTPNHCFMAGLAEHSVRPPMADEVLEYEGKFWTLSGKRLSYRRDKTQDESYFILTLFAIAREMSSSGNYNSTETVHLAVGLPPSISACCGRNLPTTSSVPIPSISATMTSPTRS